MKILWFIPTNGDSRYLGTSKGARDTGPAYVAQIAKALDELGYYGALLPTGHKYEDAWIVGASLIPITRRLKFLVALRPGLTSPTLAARMAATFDRHAEGRLLINVVAGGDPVELAGDGLFQEHDQRYDLTHEFLDIYRGLMRKETVDYEGEYLKVKGAQLNHYAAQQDPYPEIYFGGSSPAGQDVAAKHADVYLTWGEPPAQVHEKIQLLRKRTEEQGRTLRFGIRMHVIVRETTEEAWKAAEELIQYVTQESIDEALKVFARYDSEGQSRMTGLHQGRRDRLEISPNLWAGVGLLRGGAGTSLVGDPETVAARLREYAALGIEEFILSGYPHLEEAYRFAELVFPLLHKNTVAANAPLLVR